MADRAGAGCAGARSGAALKEAARSGRVGCKLKDHVSSGNGRADLGFFKFLIDPINRAAFGEALLEGTANFFSKFFKNC